MCIAVFKPSKVRLSKATLEECFTNNPDGAGYMYAHEGKIIIKKGFFTFEDFWKAYNVSINGYAKKADMVLHFRISTHGLIDEPNCHPHKINDRIAFVHNGIISNVKVPVGSKVSDTVLFNEKVLRKLPRKFEDNIAIQELIEEYIGYSKLIFLDRFGASTIINDHMGTYDKGCWFSNTTYKKPKAIVKSYKSSTYYSDYYWDYDKEKEETVEETSPLLTTEEVYYCEDCGKELAVWEVEDCILERSEQMLCQEHLDEHCIFVKSED